MCTEYVTDPIHAYTERWWERVRERQRENEGGEKERGGLLEKEKGCERERGRQVSRQTE